jgi:hypothetical protein
VLRAGLVARGAEALRSACDMRHEAMANLRTARSSRSRQADGADGVRSPAEQEPSSRGDEGGASLDQSGQVRCRRLFGVKGSDVGCECKSPGVPVGVKEDVPTHRDDTGCFLPPGLGSDQFTSDDPADERWVHGTMKSSAVKLDNKTRR